MFCGVREEYCSLFIISYNYNEECLKMSGCLELTLAIIKPHAIKVPHVLEGIQRIILSNGFYVVRSARTEMSHELAEHFYVEHKDKFFYNRLIISMTSGPMNSYVLARENAIAKWRELMGPTKVFKAKISHPETIRGKYGLTDTRNATHGSDSIESARRETALMFPDFNIDLWYTTDEKRFRRRDIIFDIRKFVHRPRD